MDALYDWSDLLTPSELEEIHDQRMLPPTRGECPETRPCPHVGCRHHLWSDINEAGNALINFSHAKPWELQETCSLDVGDRGGHTLEQVGSLLNVTRESIRQVEARALRKLKQAWEEMDSGVELPEALEPPPNPVPRVVRKPEPEPKTEEQDDVVEEVVEEPEEENVKIEIDSDFHRKVFDAIKEEHGTKIRCETLLGPLFRGKSETMTARRCKEGWISQHGHVLNDDYVRDKLFHSVVLEDAATMGVMIYRLVRLSQDGGPWVDDGLKAMSAIDGERLALCLVRQVELCERVFNARRLELTLPFMTPSQNDTYGHWGKRQSLRKKAEAEMKKQLKRMKRSELPPKGSFVDIRIKRYGHAICDYGNLVGGCKGVVDSLKALGLIVDDSPKHCTESYSQEVDRKNKRTVITLYFKGD